MSKIEINETEWYFRDLLFRNHNKGISQLNRKLSQMIWLKLILDIEMQNLGHISSILEIVLENLISSKFIELLR